MACLSDWEESDRCAPKKLAETNTHFKVPSLFYVVFSTLQQLARPSDTPDQSVPERAFSFYAVDLKTGKQIQKSGIFKLI